MPHRLMLSKDTQQSNEAFNTKEFQLPDPNGKAGGACTSAFLQIMYDRAYEIGKVSWTEILQDLHGILKEQGFNQHPQLSSSRWIDVTRPMYIVPPKSGRRRAVLIGINYVGQKGELTACHNDCENVKDYLMKAQGFSEENILVLKDDGVHELPTKKNIEDAFQRLTQYSQPGDVAFVSFSGHGGRVVDISGDEDDGFDETLIPCDFQQNGHILDDDILEYFVKKMKKGVHCCVLMDCCHSGTAMDLPYVYDSQDSTMRIEKNFNFGGEKKKVEDGSKSKAKEEDNSSVSYDPSPMPPPPVVKRRTDAPEETLPPPPPPPGQGCCVIQ